MPREPDNLEKSIRFGCGSTFGFFIGLVFAMRFFGTRNPSFLFIILLVAIICGFLALKLGDKFWNYFSK